VKPVSYYDLSLRMRLFLLSLKKANPTLSIKVHGGVKTVEIDQIIYVEEVGHTPVYHCESEEFASAKRLSLSHVEKELGAFGFARCNSSFLVNLAKCKELRRDEVVVGKSELSISRGMRRTFVTKLSEVFQIPRRKG
jgi:DNA-binding LytR/AlgR family response regulator